MCSWNTFIYWSLLLISVKALFAMVDFFFWLILWALCGWSLIRGIKNKLHIKKTIQGTMLEVFLCMTFFGQFALCINENLCCAVRSSVIIVKKNGWKEICSSVGKEMVQNRVSLRGSPAKARIRWWHFATVWTDLPIYFSGWSTFQFFPHASCWIVEYSCEKTL